MFIVDDLLFALQDADPTGYLYLGGFELEEYVTGLRIDNDTLTLDLLHDPHEAPMLIETIMDIIEDFLAESTFGVYDDLHKSLVTDVNRVEIYNKVMAVEII